MKYIPLFLLVTLVSVGCTPSNDAKVAKLESENLRLEQELAALRTRARTGDLEYRLEVDENRIQWLELSNVVAAVSSPETGSRRTLVTCDLKIAFEGTPSEQKVVNQAVLVDNGDRELRGVFSSQFKTYVSSDLLDLNFIDRLESDLKPAFTEHTGRQVALLRVFNARLED